MTVISENGNFILVSEFHLGRAPLEACRTFGHKSTYNRCDILLGSGRYDDVWSRGRQVGPSNRGCSEFRAAGKIYSGGRRELGRESGQIDTRHGRSGKQIMTMNRTTGDGRD
jgi:hypothetical protein